MSGQPHPGPHLDADSLSAFLEGMLPEHERLECMAHLAECSHCREVAFLAQEPQPVVAAPVRVRWWQRWLAPIPVLAGFAVVCALAVGTWLYLYQPPAAPVPYADARPRPVPQVPAPPAAKTTVSPKSEPVRTHESLPARSSASFGATSIPAPPPAPMAVPAAPQPASTPPTPPPPPAPPLPKTGADQNALTFEALTAPAAPRPSPNGGPLRLSIEHNRAAADDLSEVAGAVTDPSGSAIPGASVTLHAIAGTSNINARTDDSGHFKIAALPPGRYELQVAAPGFQRASGQIELQAQDLAMVAPVLSVGAATETVEVAAAASGISTSTAAIAKSRQPTQATAPLKAATTQDAVLASGGPAGSSVARGKLMLRVDAGGALSFSKDSGKHWKIVKPAWPDHVIRVSLAEASESTEVFQLMTDSGSAWLSRDGTHWRRSPSPR
jgi:hypothetical protein